MYVFVYVCTYLGTYVFTHAREYACIYVLCTYARTYARMFLCVLVFEYLCICAHEPVSVHMSPKSSIVTPHYFT